MPFADQMLWLTFALLLMLAATLNAAKTALAAASRSKLRALAEKGDHGAVLAMRLADLAPVMAALRVGMTVALVAAAYVAHLVGQDHALGTLFAMIAVVLIGVEALPRTLALTYPETVSTRTALFARVVGVALTPLVTLIAALIRLILRLFALKPEADSHFLGLRDDIAGAIAHGHSSGAVEKEDRDRLLGALDLADRTVDEIMRHRRQIEMVDADDDPDAIVTQVLASSHSRLPVYRGNEENILGVIHTKDLLREVDRLVRGPEGSDLGGIKALDIVKVAMKPYFIPDTTALDEQMRAFLKRHAHFALVVDEYGGLQGLITLEDILEEIVGDITDEFDVVARDAGLKRSENGEYLVDGAMTIRDLNRALDWRLPDDEANTVAGLVIHEAQMIPNEGQAFSFHGFRFEVAQRRENRLTKLKMRPL
jgi:Mg2+/Co2+ transporter CorB